MLSRVRLAGLLLAILPPTPAPAQDLPKPAEIVRPAFYVSVSAVAPGGEARMAVVGEILPGWHVNAHVPSEDFLIATEVEFEPLDGIHLGPPAWPEGEMVTFEFAGQALRVYDKNFTVRAPLRVESGAAPGARTVSGTLTYQPCNDRICLPPAKVPFSGEIRIAAPGEASEARNPEIFADREPPAMPGGAPPAGPGQGVPPVEGTSPLVFVAIFLGGLALNLTPCVYPLIPITVAYFGGQVSRSPARTFGLALLYLMGMAATYSTLGVVAALTGSLFGAALQSPWVLLGMALVMVALALSMFGLYEFSVPGAGSFGARSGPLGALSMGLLVGLVAAPCIGPLITALLVTVAREGDPVLGFWKFFVLSLGLGAPYLVLATFSGGLSRLPRSGQWMDAVKRIFGLALLAMAAYFAGLALPVRAGRWLLPAALAGGAVWLALFERATARWFHAVRLTLAAAAAAFAVWLIWPAPSTGIRFEPYTDEALALARAAGQPVLIDFTADWCVPCREYEVRVFTDRQVSEAAADFRALRADLTRAGSPEVRQLIREWSILGPPTIVFIGKDGRERLDLRLTGFVPAVSFLERMRMATAPEAEASGAGDSPS